MQKGTQGRLDLLSQKEESRKARGIDIDPKRIEAELNELAGNTPFRFHIKPHLPLCVAVHETDKCVDIQINPKRIRTREQLDQVMQFCHSSLRLV